MTRDPEPSEIAEDLAALAATTKEGQAAILKEIAALRREMAETYLRKDVYEARHTALRTETAMQFAELQATAGGARSIAMWALGLICTAVVVGLVGFLIAAAGGAPS